MNMNNMNQLEDNSYSGLFIGTVVDNNDLEFRQRIKVSIPGLFGTEVDSLPWIGPLVTSSFGMGPTYKTVSVPAIGSNVVIQFQNEDPHYGVYLGCLDTVSVGAVPELLVNYPNRRGWKDPWGNIFYVDSFTGEARFVHGSGSMSLLIDSSGAVTLTSPLTTIVGDLLLQGNYTSNGTMTNNGVNVGSTHVHLQNDGNSQGGGVTSDPPQ